MEEPKFKYILLIIVFITGYNLVLPVGEINLPFYFRPYQVFHGIFIDQALIILLVIVITLQHKGKLNLFKEENSISKLILLLFLIGILSSLINGFLIDILKAMRIFIYYIYLKILLSYSKKISTNIILKTFIVGIICGSIVNIYYTFSYQENYLHGFPTLLGQSGPGGNASMAILLGALLMIFNKNRTDRMIAICILMVGTFVTSISYSKMALFIACLGWLLWIYIIFVNFNKIKLYLGLIMIISVLYYLKNDEIYDEFLRSRYELFEVKLRGAGIEGSDNKRYNYLLAVPEIVLNNPILGVSYSGFYPAYTKTNAFLQDIASNTEEYNVNNPDNNPHSMLLHYASANGITGIIIIISILVYFIKLLKKCFINCRYSSYVVSTCIFLSFLIYIIVVPTLFVNPIFYITISTLFQQFNI